MSCSKQPAFYREGGKKIGVFLYLIMAAWAHCESQPMDMTIGSVLDSRKLPQQTDLQAEEASTAFVGVKNSTALFFNEGHKMTYFGFGFHRKALRFAVSEDHVNYSGIKSLTSKTISGKSAINAFINIDTSNYMVHSEATNDTDEAVVYVTEVSKDMATVGSPVVLTRFKDHKRDGMRIFVSSSEDKNYWLISRIVDGKGKDPWIELRVVDQSFAPVWSRDITIYGPFTENSIRSLELDNAGNFYMLAEEESSTSSEARFYAYYWRSESLKPTDLRNESAKIFGVNAKVLDGERVILMGLSQLEEDVSYFYAQVNKESQEVGPLKFTRMPEDFLEGFDKKFGISWRVSELVPLDNGDVVASIERQKHTEGMMKSNRVYILSLGDDGKINWIRRVYKTQEMPYEYAGHKLLTAGNKTFVVYNDHEDNLSKTLEDDDIKAFDGRKGMPAIVEIDETGKGEKRPFFPGAEMEGYLISLSNLFKISDHFYYCLSKKYKGIYTHDLRNVSFRVM